MQLLGSCRYHVEGLHILRESSRCTFNKVGRKVGIVLDILLTSWCLNW